MKNILERKQSQFLKRRTNNSHTIDVPVLRPKKELVLLNEQGPKRVFQCNAHEDGSMIALVGLGQFWYISMFGVTSSWRAPRGVSMQYVECFFRQENNQAILADCKGFICFVCLRSHSIFPMLRCKTPIGSMAFISATKFVAGCDNGALCFYEHRNGQSAKLLRSIRGIHSKRINQVVVYDKLLVAVSTCHTVSVWDVTQEKRIAMLPHCAPVYKTVVNQHFIVTMSYSEVRLFKNRAGYPLCHVFKGIDGNWDIFCVEIIGKCFLLTAGTRSMITVVSLEKKLPIMRIETTLPSILNMSLTPDGQVIASCFQKVHLDGDSNSSTSDSFLNGINRCVAIELTKKYGIRNKLKNEAMCRFEVISKKANWKLRAIIAVLLYATISLCRRE